MKKIIVVLAAILGISSLAAVDGIETYVSALQALPDKPSKLDITRTTPEQRNLIGWMMCPYVDGLNKDIGKLRQCVECMEYAHPRGIGSANINWSLPDALDACTRCTATPVDPRPLYQACLIGPDKYCGTDADSKPAFTGSNLTQCNICMNTAGAGDKNNPKTFLACAELTWYQDVSGDSSLTYANGVKSILANEKGCLDLTLSQDKIRECAGLAGAQAAQATAAANNCSDFTGDKLGACTDCMSKAAGTDANRQKACAGLAHYLDIAQKVPSWAGAVDSVVKDAQNCLNIDYPVDRTNHIGDPLAKYKTCTCAGLGDWCNQFKSSAPSVSMQDYCAKGPHPFTGSDKGGNLYNCNLCIANAGDPNDQRTWTACSYLTWYGEIANDKLPTYKGGVANMLKDPSCLAIDHDKADARSKTCTCAGLPATC